MGSQGPDNALDFFGCELLESSGRRPVHRAAAPPLGDLSPRSCATAASGVVHIVDPKKEARRRLARLAIADGLEVRTYGDAGALFNAARSADAGSLVVDAGFVGQVFAMQERRPRPDRSAYPVIVKAELAQFAVAVRAIRAGVSDILEKPF